METTKKSSKMKVALLSMALAVVLALTMMPLAPMQTANADPNVPAPQIIQVGYGTYYYNIIEDEYVIVPSPVAPVDVMIGDLAQGADVRLIDNDAGYAAAFFRDRAPSSWRVAAATQYANVQEILEVGARKLHITWDPSKDLGFATTDVPAEYPLYVSPYEKVSGVSPLHMGLNTRFDSTEFGSFSDSYPFIDKALSNAHDSDYPRAVIALDSVSIDLEDELDRMYAGNFLGQHDPLANMRYLEGGTLGADAGDPLETWGRRFPSSVTTLYILTETAPPSAS